MAKMNFFGWFRRSTDKPESISPTSDVSEAGPSAAQITDRAASSPPHVAAPEPSADRAASRSRVADSQPMEEARVPVDLTPESVSKESLKAIFDAAFMDTTFDSDGDLRVKDRCNCWVTPSPSGDRIQFMAIFRFKPGVSRERRLEFINELNRQYIVVKAVAGDNDSLIFYFDVLVGGGLTPKALVWAFKRFAGIPHDAISDLGNDLVE